MISPGHSQSLSLFMVELITTIITIMLEDKAKAILHLCSLTVTTYTEQTRYYNLLSSFYFFPFQNPHVDTILLMLRLFISSGIPLPEESHATGKDYTYPLHENYKHILGEIFALKHTP